MTCDNTPKSPGTGPGSRHGCLRSASAARQPRGDGGRLGVGVVPGPGPEETPQAVLAPAGHDVDVQVRDALADDGVRRGEACPRPRARRPATREHGADRRARAGPSARRAQTFRCSTWSLGDDERVAGEERPVVEERADRARRGSRGAPAPPPRRSRRRGSPAPRLTPGSCTAAPAAWPPPASSTITLRRK